MTSRRIVQATNAAMLCALAALASVAPGGEARADCKPIIAAFLKADASKRFAIYTVDSLDETPKGEPTFITIGDVKYSEHNVKKGPLDFVKDGYTKGSAMAGFEADSVRSDEQKGKIKCKPTTDRKISGEPAEGYHVGSTGGVVNGLDPGAFDMWISKATGLPLIYSPDPDSGGFRYVYGNQVEAPVASKIRQ